MTIDCEYSINSTVVMDSHNQITIRDAAFCVGDVLSLYKFQVLCGYVRDVCDDQKNLLQIKRTCDGLRNEILEKNKLLEENDRVIEGLNGGERAEIAKFKEETSLQLRNQCERIIELNSRVQEATSRNTSLESELLSLQCRHRETEISNQRLTSEIERLNKELHCYRNSAESLQFEMQDLSASIDERVVVNVKLQERLEMLAKSKEEESNRNRQQMQRNVNKLRTLISSLLRQIDSKDSEVLKILARIKEGITSQPYVNSNDILGEGEGVFEDELQKLELLIPRVSDLLNLPTEIIAFLRMKESQFESMNSSLKVQASELESLHQQITRMKVASEETNSRNQSIILELQSKLHTSESNLQRAYADLGDLSQEFQDTTSRLQGTITHLQEENARLLSRLENMNGRNQTVQAEIDQLHLEREELRRRVEEASRTNNEQAQNMDRMVKEIASLNRRLEETGVELEGLRREMRNSRSTYESTITTYQSQITQLQSAVHNLENELRDRDNQIVQYRSHISRLEEELQNSKCHFEEAVTSYKRSSNQLSHMLQELQAKTDELVIHLDAANNAKSAMEEELIIKDRIIEDLHSDIDAFKRKLSELTQTRDQELEQLGQREARLSDAVRRWGYLTEDIRKALDRRDSAIENLLCEIRGHNQCAQCVQFNKEFFTEDEGNLDMLYTMERRLQQWEAHLQRIDNTHMYHPQIRALVSDRDAKISDLQHMQAQLTQQTQQQCKELIDANEVKCKLFARIDQLSAELQSLHTEMDCMECEWRQQRQEIDDTIYNAQLQLDDLSVCLVKKNTDSEKISNDVLRFLGQLREVNHQLVKVFGSHQQIFGDTMAAFGIEGVGSVSMESWRGREDLIFATLTLKQEMTLVDQVTKRLKNWSSQVGKPPSCRRQDLGASPAMDPSKRRCETPVMNSESRPVLSLVLTRISRVNEHLAAALERRCQLMQQLVNELWKSPRRLSLATSDKSHRLIGFPNTTITTISSPQESDLYGMVNEKLLVLEKMISEVDDLADYCQELKGIVGQRDATIDDLREKNNSLQKLAREGEDLRHDLNHKLSLIQSKTDRDTLLREVQVDEQYGRIRIWEIEEDERKHLFSFASMEQRSESRAPAFIGVEIKDLSGSDTEVNQYMGVKVVSVRGPALNGGVLVHDIITHLEQYPTHSISSFTTAASTIKAGDTVRLTLYRNGIQRVIQVVTVPASAPSTRPLVLPPMVSMTCSPNGSNSNPTSPLTPTRYPRCSLGSNSSGSRIRSSSCPSSASSSHYSPSPESTSPVMTPLPMGGSFQRTRVNSGFTPVAVQLTGPSPRSVSSSRVHTVTVTENTTRTVSTPTRGPLRDTNGNQPIKVETKRKVTTLQRLQKADPPRW